MGWLSHLQNSKYESEIAQIVGVEWMVGWAVSTATALTLIFGVRDYYFPEHESSRIAVAVLCWTE